MINETNRESKEREEREIKEAEERSGGTGATGTSSSTGESIASGISYADAVTTPRSERRNTGETVNEDTGGESEARETTKINLLERLGGEEKAVARWV